jgi:hypothetical protein
MAEGRLDERKKGRKKERKWKVSEVTHLIEDC